jgi:hypothetical protein
MSLSTYTHDTPDLSASAGVQAGAEGVYLTTYTCG